MNQLGGQEPPQSTNKKPVQINVHIIVNLQRRHLNYEISIDPDIPFIIFLEGIKKSIFAQAMSAQYQEKIKCQLQNGDLIHQNEQRSLKMLGLTNHCTLFVNLFLRQCRDCEGQQQGPKIKVQLEYELPYDPNFSMMEYTNRITNAIHFDESKISNFSISSIKIDSQQY